LQITATREASKISAGYCAGVLVLDEKYSHMALCMHQVLAQNQYPRRVAAPVRLRDFVFATARHSGLHASNPFASSERCAMHCESCYARKLPWAADGLSVLCRVKPTVALPERSSVLTQVLQRRGKLVLRLRRGARTGHQGRGLTADDLLLLSGCRCLNAVLLASEVRALARLQKKPLAGAPRWLSALAVLPCSQEQTRRRVP